MFSKLISLISAEYLKLLFAAIENNDDNIDLIKHVDPDRTKPTDPNPNSNDEPNDTTTTPTRNAQLPRPEDLYNAMESQNGFRTERGSRDADGTITSGFAARREHGLPTWCCYIDFVKAFDTVPRELLWIILAKFGAPPKLVRLL